VKVLTLTQPWATLVALGEKHIETRGWWTGYRGPLLIHAAKSFPRDCRELCDESPFTEVLQRYGISHWRELPLGAILCETSLDDCLPTNRILDIWSMTVPSSIRKVPRAQHELNFGNYAPNRYGFVLGDVTRAPAPIPAKGALGLWEYDWRAA
jgi:hypothetical protein